MSVNHVLHVRPACTSTLSVAGVSSVLVVITLMGGTLAVRRVLGHQNQWPVWSTGTGITYRPAPTSPASVYISVVSTSCSSSSCCCSSCSSCRGILIWHDWNRTSLCAQFVQAAHCSPPTIFFLKIPSFWCSTFKFRIFTEQNWGSPPTHSRENSPPRPILWWLKSDVPAIVTMVQLVLFKGSKNLKGGPNIFPVFFWQFQLFHVCWNMGVWREKLWRSTPTPRENTPLIFCPKFGAYYCHEGSIWGLQKLEMSDGW